MELREDGSRRVGLWLPFRHDDVLVSAVEFRAVCYADVVAVEMEEITGALGLMSALSGLSTEALMQIRFPDFPRVMNEFLFHLPDELRDTITRLRVPTTRPAVEPEQRSDGETQAAIDRFGPEIAEDGGDFVFDEDGHRVFDTPEHIPLPDIEPAGGGNSPLGEFTHLFPKMPPDYVPPNQRPGGGFSVAEHLAKLKAEGGGWRNPSDGSGRRDQPVVSNPGAALGLDLGDGK